MLYHSFVQSQDAHQIDEEERPDCMAFHVKDSDSDLPRLSRLRKS